MESYYPLLRTLSPPLFGYGLTLWLSWINKYQANDPYNLRPKALKLLPLFVETLSLGACNGLRGRMVPLGYCSGEYPHSHSQLSLIFRLQLARCQSQGKPSLTGKPAHKLNSTEWLNWEAHRADRDWTFSFLYSWPWKQWETIKLKRRACAPFPLSFIFSSRLCICILITCIY